MRVGTVIIVILTGFVAYLFVMKSGLLGPHVPTTGTSAASGGTQNVTAGSVFGQSLGLVNSAFSLFNSTAKTTPSTT